MIVLIMPWVDDEHRTHRFGVSLARHDHAVLCAISMVMSSISGNFTLDVLHVAERDLLLDRAQPGNVAVQTIDGQSDEFCVEFSELSSIDANVMNLLVHTGVKSAGG